MAQLQKKGKRKRWYSILPTPQFRLPEIGESFTADPSILVGKTITMNAMDLTRDPKKQNIKITFGITEVKDNKALTEVKRYEIIPSSIKRMVHQGKSKIDSSFKLETKDNIKVTAKPVIVTRAKTPNSILTKIRKQSEDFLKTAIKNNSYQDNLNSLLANKLQSQLREYLKKVYPISGCHIRMFEKQ
jgi:ribosomal protein S3AE